jgi:hypothetical protein
MLRFHGMWHGLKILACTYVPPAAAAATERCIEVDDQFVRLMANLVLRTHTELTHVY